MGSAHIFSDSFIHKEDNEKVNRYKKWQFEYSFSFLYLSYSKVFNTVLQWLTTDEVHLNQIDAEDPEVDIVHTHQYVF